MEQQPNTTSSAAGDLTAAANTAAPTIATQPLDAPSQAQTQERKTKSISESKLWLAEIVGESSHEGKRLDAGGILDIMDLLAGRIAATHAEGSVVTLSFDRVDLTVPIMHNDLVRLEGQIVKVGSSSIVVLVECFRHDSHTSEFIRTHRSFITMVAVDKDGKPNKNIPGLRYESPEEEKLKELAEQRERLSKEWVHVQLKTEECTALTAGDVVDPVNQGKKDYIPIAQTAITVRRQFLPRNRNYSDFVFGGDILLWMDRTATYCARNFTKNKNMITLSMNRVFFKKPVSLTDLVEMRARVVYVRTYTVCVEIDVFLYPYGSGGKPVPSHTGYFTVLNFDEAGFKRKVMTGIDLSSASLEELQAYAKAKARHQFWEKEKSTHDHHDRQIAEANGTPRDKVAHGQDISNPHIKSFIASESHSKRIDSPH